MPIRIRRATLDDWCAARELRLEMLRDSPHAFGDSLDDVLGWDDDRWQVRASSMLLPDSAWFAAVTDDGRWLGQMAGREYGSDAWLVEVYLSASLRRTGVAASLLTEIELWATSRGRWELFLEVNEHSTAARRFYERAGFVATGRVTPHPLFPRHEEIEMVKRLRPESV